MPTTKKAAVTKKAVVASKARMNFRLAAEIKERVARAAAITGQEMTDFAVSTLSERADEVIERHTIITLNGEEHDFFLRALDADDRVASERSLAAAERYRQGRRKGVKYHW